MATLARDALVRAHQGKRRLRMRAQPDLFRQPCPANTGVAVFTSISELRLVHLRVTGHALRAHARSRNVALVVTGLALRLGMARCEAQTRMVLPDVVNLAPIGFVVTGGAFLPPKGPLMGIFVAGHTVGLQAEEGCVSAPVTNIVTVLASR
jgi:hypothetical protein